MNACTGSSPLNIENLKWREHWDETHITDLIKGKVQLSETGQSRESIQVPQFAARHPEHGEVAQTSAQVTNTRDHTATEPQLAQVRNMGTWEGGGGGGGGGEVLYRNGFYTMYL